MAEIGNKTYYYHKDHLGSIDKITNNAGKIVQKNVYSAFGKIIHMQDGNGNKLSFDGELKPLDQPFYFTGREWDETLDLYYYRARYYSPNTGRFIQQDPIGLAAGDTNLYRYVFNNPIKFTDPMGLDAYLASRDVGTVGTPVSHNFVVVQNASGVQVFSFGRSSNGTLQNVAGSGTHKNDRNALTSLDTQFTRISASDAAVISAAGQVSNTLRSLQLQYTFPGTTNMTLNSNTAAQAVANMAQGSTVTTPSSSYLGAPGAENAPLLQNACGR